MTLPIREQAADLCSARAHAADLDDVRHAWPAMVWTLALNTACNVVDEWYHRLDFTVEEAWLEAECRLREPEGRR